MNQRLIEEINRVVALILKDGGISGSQADLISSEIQDLTADVYETGFEDGKNVLKNVV